MALELKTNTSCQIPIGPLVDSTDGKTAETAITVASCLVQIARTYATAASPVTVATFVPTASGGSNDMVHVTGDTAGLYSLELTSAQLNWYGPGKITVYDVDKFLIYHTDIQIVSANYYNNKYGTTIAKVDVDTIKEKTITCASNITVKPVIGYNTVIAEPSVAAPTASPSAENILSHIYFTYRNKKETTATYFKVYDDAGTTVIFKSSRADDGSTYTQGEFVSG